MMPNHSCSVLPYRASMLRTWAAMPSSTLAMASPFALAVDFGEPPGEELPLGGRRIEGERGPVGVARLGGASQPAQQVGAAGVQQGPAPDLAVRRSSSRMARPAAVPRPSPPRWPGWRAPRARARGGPAPRTARRSRPSRCWPRPRRRGRRRSQRAAGRGRAAGARGRRAPLAFADLRLVPPAAVLLLEQDQRRSAGPGRPGGRR